MLPFLKLWKVRAFQTVQSHMLALTKKHKVFWAVIARIVIYVMNVFAAQEQPAEFVFHDKAMFGNVIANSARMVGIVNLDIPARVNRFATLPAWRKRTPLVLIVRPHLSPRLFGVFAAFRKRVVLKASGAHLRLRSFGMFVTWLGSRINSLSGGLRQSVYPIANQYASA